MTLSVTLVLFSLVSCLFIGNFLSVRVFGRSLNQYVDIFVGVVIVSSVLSLFYNFTSFLLAKLFCEITLLIFLLALFHLGSLKDCFKISKFGWFIRITISGLFFTAIYCWPVISNVNVITSDGGLSMAHFDLFTHGTYINQIRLQQLIGNTSNLLSDTSAQFYHYGIYIIPALLSNELNIEGIKILIYVVIPFGIFIMWILLNEFISDLLGDKSWRVQGLSLLVLLVSDVSRSAINPNFLFDFPYLLLASPGALWGMCIVLFGIINVCINKKLIFIQTLSIIFLLVSIRILYVPIYFFTILIFFILISNIKNINKIYFIFIVILVVTIFGYFLNTPIAEYYKFLSSFQYKSFINYFGGGRLTLIFLSIAATIGWTIIILIGLTGGALLLKGSINNSQRLLSILFVSIFLAYYCALQLAIPLRGDMTELSQRPFIVFNMLISISLICQIYISLGIVSVVIFLTVMLGLNVIKYRAYGFPVDHPWHILTFKIHVEKEIVNIAHQFLGNQVGARFVFVPVQREYFGSYPEAVITSMTLSQAFISRLGLNRQNYGDENINLNAKEEYIKNILDCTSGSKVKNDIYFISKKNIACLNKVASFGSYTIFK